ncbi:unnamed protein product [Alternaria alternata]
MVVTYPTVAAICDRCSSQFSRYLKDPFPGTELQAQRLRSDLNVFIGTFAVHASGLFSLDSLLCAEPGYSKKLLFLLGNTAENLERGDCIGNPRRFLDADSFLAVEARQNQTAHPRVATDRSVFDDNGSAASSEDSLNTLMTQFTSAVDPLKVVKRNMQRLSLLAKYIRAAVPFLQLQQYADRIEGLDRRTSMDSSPITNSLSIGSQQQSRCVVCDSGTCKGIPENFILLSSNDRGLKLRLNLNQNYYRLKIANYSMRHVIDDLQPYVCLHQECNRSLETYKNIYLWIQHMGQHDMKWYCDSPKHATHPLCFDTEEEFRIHLEMEHSPSSASQYSVPLEATSLISRNSMRPSLAFLREFSDGNSEWLTTEEMVQGVLAEVSSHLLEIALLSQLSPDETGDVQVYSDTSQSSSLSLSDYQGSWDTDEKISTYSGEDGKEPSVLNDVSPWSISAVNLTENPFPKGQSKVEWWLNGLDDPKCISHHPETLDSLEVGKTE